MVYIGQIYWLAARGHSVCQSNMAYNEDEPQVLRKACNMLVTLAVLAILFFGGMLAFAAYLMWYLSRPENKLRAFKEEVLRAKGYSDAEIETFLANENDYEAYTDTH